MQISRPDLHATFSLSHFLVLPSTWSTNILCALMHLVSGRLSEVVQETLSFLLLSSLGRAPDACPIVASCCGRLIGTGRRTPPNSSRRPSSCWRCSCYALQLHLLVHSAMPPTVSSRWVTFYGYLRRIVPPTVCVVLKSGACKGPATSISFGPVFVLSCALCSCHVVLTCSPFFAVLQVQIAVRDKLCGLSDQVKRACLSLVDLAGSERACLSGVWFPFFFLLHAPAP